MKLCGFPVSNYYNKVKLALLEKQLAFEEEMVYPSADASLLTYSPMGKVPYLRDGDFVLSESQAIVEYLEANCPEPPLFPRDARGTAKVRELIEVIELYLELPARRLYGEAYFGGKASDDVKKEVATSLSRGVRAFARLAHFEPYLHGDAFGLADCAAVAHLPVVSGAIKAIYGEDMLSGVGGLAEYLNHAKSRPSVMRVEADRSAGLGAFIALRKRS